MSNYIEPRSPSAKGMRVISIKRVPMNLIVSNKDTHDNKARFKGLSNVKVSEYAALITNGNYCPEYYIPPVVVKEGNKYLPGSFCYRLYAMEKVRSENDRLASVKSKTFIQFNESEFPALIFILRR